MTLPVRRVTTHTGDRAWMVSGYSLVRSLLTDTRLARSHHEPQAAARLSRSAVIDRPRQAAENEDADHRQVRRLLLSALSPTRLAALEGAVRGLVDDLLGNLARRSAPADFHAVVSQPLPALVIGELLGLPRTDLPPLVAWSAQATSVDSPDAGLGYDHLCRYLRERAGGGAVRPRRLLGMLARNYPPSIAVATAAELFITGHQTTTVAIDKSVVLLLTSPLAVRHEACGAERVERTVEELMRLPSPVVAPGTARLLPRYARTTIQVDQTRIEAGDLVLLALDEANLDERVFPAPATADFRRHPNPHLGFGLGPYSCLGAALARLELRVLFETLFRRLPGLELAVPVDRLRARDDQLMGGIATLPVTW